MLVWLEKCHILGHCLSIKHNKYLCISGACGLLSNLRYWNNSNDDKGTLPSSQNDRRMSP